MALTIESPYGDPALPWLKGNLHAHTTLSDGKSAPEEVIALYEAGGYDFLMISDHDRFAGQGVWPAKSLTLIPGNEVTAYGPHLLHVNAHRFIPPDSDRQLIIDDINTDAGFCVVCHPNWEASYNHCDQGLLEAWEDYSGIEIYNGVCRRLEGSPVATDRWDRLLGAGRRVWGFANDDAHDTRDIGVAWNMVQSEKRHIGAIVDALVAGRFYASTGVLIQRVAVTENTLQIETENAEAFQLISNFGRVVATESGPALQFQIPENFHGDYLRVECFGPGLQQAWTQPFFIHRG